jgi:hypothetical protein
MPKLKFSNQALTMRRGILAVFVWAATGLYAQTFSISESTVARGRMGSFLIRLNSPQDKAIVSLQWELILPPGFLANPADIVAGSAAESAEKSITCVQKKAAVTEKRSIFACILAGGQKRIPDGAIALVQYHAAPAVPAADYPVQIDAGLAISVDLQKIPFAKAEGTIKVVI